MKTIVLGILAIMSSLNLLFYIPYKSEKNFIEAVKKTWKNRPIYSISTIPLDGYEKYELFDQRDINTFCDCTFVKDYKKPSSNECSSIQKSKGCIEYSKNIAYLYKNKEFYVKYYEADYLTLFSRVHDEYFGKCKTGYTICGILDTFKNSFCVIEGEKCPINYININKEEFKYIGEEYNTINRLYVSEKEKATILDINRIFTQIDMSNYLDGKIDNFTKDIYFYNLTYLNDYIRKDEFVNENNLIIGKMPAYFSSSYFNLQHLVYPGNLKNHTLNFFYIGLIDCRLAILFPFLLLKILLGLAFLYFNDKTVVKKIFYYLFIFIIISYIIMEIFNLLFFIGRLELHFILNYYETYIYKSNEIYLENFIALFIFEILFNILDIVIIIFAGILILNLKIEKIENLFENGLINENDNNIN